MQIELPNQWEPRSYQLPLWTALEQGVKRLCCVWHRRSGKDLTVLNYIAVASQKRVGTYYHVAPTYRQGRKIIWEGIRGDGLRFLDAFPGWRDPGPAAEGHFVTRVRDDEMTLWPANGSVVQVIGADDVDRLVGVNPVFVAMTEYSVQNPMFWELIRPVLVENGGTAVFIYTPRGRNHGYSLYKRSQDSDAWFSELLSTDDTARLSKAAGEPVPVTEEQIQCERDDGMAPELAEQEFGCSFDAPLEGSYFGDLVTRVRGLKQVGKYPYDPVLPVNTAWDIGHRDSTAIIFYQQHRSEIRIIDYYENQGEEMGHYIKMLHEKPYVYEDHAGPHDLKVHDWSATGKARYEIARDLGVHFRILRKLSREDGIQAARSILPRCYFHEETCDRLLQALTEYTKKKEPNGLFSDQPQKDWTNHPADAFRYLAIALRPKRTKTPQRLAPRLAIV